MYFDSEIADHCANFGLSYVRKYSASKLNIECNHSHVRNCLDCNQIELLKKKFELEIQNLIDNIDDQSEMLDIVKQSFNCISEWQHHLMRTFTQDFIKDKVLNDLKHGEALIFGDWAMKYNPKYYRETQEQWFAKKEIPWHVSEAIFVDENGTKRSLTFVNIFDSCSKCRYRNLRFCFSKTKIINWHQENF